MGEERKHGDDLRGASRLAIEATKGIVDLVRAMHETIGGGPAVLGRPLEGATRTLGRPIYGGISAVTDLVGTSIDVALGQLAPLLGRSRSGPERDAVLAALNGVLGDYLSPPSRCSSEATGERCRSKGRRCPKPCPTQGASCWSWPMARA